MRVNCAFCSNKNSFLWEFRVVKGIEWIEYWKSQSASDYFFHYFFLTQEIFMACYNLASLYERLWSAKWALCSQSRKTITRKESFVSTITTLGYIQRLLAAFSLQLSPPTTPYSRPLFLCAKRIYTRGLSIVFVFSSYQCRFAVARETVEE